MSDGVIPTLAHLPARLLVEFCPLAAWVGVAHEGGCAGTGR